MKGFFRRHGLIFLPAAIIGLLVVFPTVLAIYRIYPDFKGIYPMFNNDETHYVAMTREAADGHYNFGNVYLKEYKDVPYITPSLAEIFLVAEARLLDVSVPAAAAVNDFLLPFIGVIVLYFLMLEMSGRRSVAGFFSFFYFLLFVFYFNRPINPQVSFIPMFLGLYFILRILAAGGDSGWRRPAMLNFLFAASISPALYIYPYSWAVVLAVYSFCLLFSVIMERKIAAHAVNFLIFAVSSAIFTAPYFLNLGAAESFPYYIDIWKRFGFLLNHYPAAYLNVLVALAGLPALYLAGRSSDYRKDIFAYSLVFSGVAVNWQNVLTGEALSFSTHYYQIVVLFLFLILAFCLVNSFKAPVRGWRNYLVAVAAVILPLFLFVWERRANDFGAQWFLIPTNISEFRNWQKLSVVAGWFDENTPKDSSIYYLGRNYGWFIPIYTSNNVFWNPDVGRFLISDDELENRWVIQNFFRKGIDEKSVESENMNIWTNEFIERYQNEVIRNKILGVFGVENPPSILVPREYISRVLEKVEFYRNLGFEKSLKKYSADYILLDRNDPEFGYLEAEFRNYPFLELAAVLDNNLIFRVIR